LTSSELGDGPCIVLKPGRESPARKRHHPWIYSQAVSQVTGETSAPDLLPVVASDRTLVGWGYYSPSSLIAVRMVSFTAERPSADWAEQRTASAYRLRQALHLDTDALRVVNAEGDFLPGLIVDLYGDTAVMTAHVRGMEAQADRIAACLRGLVPGANVYFKRDEHYARVEGLARASGYLAGSGSGTCLIREGPVKLQVDYQNGQKTGYYLDQRASRRLIARCGAGRNVLNLFAYTGAVALAAAAAGAKRVVSVESSRRAIELARENVALNPELSSCDLEWVQADVFSFLENAGTHDVVVADPPPFARRRAELQGALQGYLSLFEQCIRILAADGLAFLFSCSGAVDKPMLRDIVVEAGRRAGRQVRLLKELHADLDHPVAATHPEGEYLKGWLVHAQ
jgi:23S rRNA (cytosine1962-C5)-methyltransferase